MPFADHFVTHAVAFRIVQAHAVGHFGFGALVECAGEAEQFDNGAGGGAGHRGAAGFQTRRQFQHRDAAIVTELHGGEDAGRNDGDGPVVIPHAYGFDPAAPYIDANDVRRSTLEASQYFF